MTDTHAYDIAEAPPLTASAGELPRLLAGIGDGGHMSLDEHHALRGPLPADVGLRPGRGRRREASPLVDAIEAAALRGRGGAAFPSAAKLHAVAAARGRPIVVVNASEGEPASGKDRTLIEIAPHLVLDGAQLAADAVAADEVIVAVCELAVSGIEALTLAIDEREHEPGLRDRARIELALVPPHYVAGQETALVNHLNGGPALPTFTPPRVWEAGVAGRPTLVNNPETLANIALIGRFGAAWFRELGTAAEPGSALVTLSGSVAHPGVYEIELGTSLESLLTSAGGLSGAARAALVGGYAGTWMDIADPGAVALCNEALASQGGSLGAGVIAVLSDQACPVSETARLARWLAGQSARQCGPCLHGLDTIAATIEALAGGAVHEPAGRRLEQLGRLTAGRGACGHPDGSVRVLISALRLFWDEVQDHVRHGRCDACALAPELPFPARTVDASRRAGARTRR